MKSQRIVVFDLLRVILIILIVNIHIRILSQTFTNFISPFEYLAVPLFLLLSFFLTSKYFLCNNLPITTFFSRAKRLFIPLIFWSCIGFIPHLSVISPFMLFMQLITGEVVNVPLYYLNLVILFTFLFWLFTYIPKHLRYIVFVLLIVFCFVLQYTGWNYHFFVGTHPYLKDSYGRFVELFPFAISGVLLGTPLFKKYLIATLVALLCLTFLLPFPVTNGFHYQGLSLFIESVAAFIIVLLLRHMSFSEKLNEGISTLGKYSFGIYLFHFTLLEILIFLFPSLKVIMWHNNVLFLFMYVIFCYSLCFGIAKLTKNRFSYLFT